MIIIKDFNVSIIETIGFTVNVKAQNKTIAERIAKKAYEEKRLVGSSGKELLEVEYIAELTD